MLVPYQPTAYLDYSQSEHRASYEAALKKIRAGFGRSHALYIGGEWVLSKGKSFVSVNPAQKDEVIGEFAAATLDHVSRRSPRGCALFPPGRRCRSRSGRESCCAPRG